MVDVKKTMQFLRFLICAREPLRRSAWSMLRTEDFCIFCGARATLWRDRHGSAVHARPSAEIRVVDVKKLPDRSFESKKSLGCDLDSYKN